MFFILNNLKAVTKLRSISPLHWVSVQERVLAFWDRPNQFVSLMVCSTWSIPRIEIIDKGIFICHPFAPSKPCFESGFCRFIRIEQADTSAASMQRYYDYILLWHYVYHILYIQGHDRTIDFIWHKIFEHGRIKFSLSLICQICLIWP